MANRISRAVASVVHGISRIVAATIAQVPVLHLFATAVLLGALDVKLLTDAGRGV